MDMNTEDDHVVVSVPLMRNGYGYGTVPDRRRTIGTVCAVSVRKAVTWVPSRILSGHCSLDK